MFAAQQVPAFEKKRNFRTYFSPFFGRLYMSRLFTYILLALTLLPVVGHAQSNTPYSLPYFNRIVGNWGVTASIGTAVYSGDLSSRIIMPSTSPLFNLNWSIGAVYRATNYISFRGEYSRFSLSSTDHDPLRQISFSGSYWDIVGIMEHDLLPRDEFDAGWIRVQPYVLTGLGLCRYSPSVNPAAPIVFGGTPPNLEPIPVDNGQEPRLSGLALVAPVGLGARFPLRYNMDMALEWNMRCSFSDYIDGVSKRGSASGRDFYHMVTLRLTYNRDFRFNYQKVIRKVLKKERKKK